jgi:chemotaxis protein CheX
MIPELMNAFIQSAVTIIETMTCTKVAAASVSHSRMPLDISGVAAGIGFTGELNGQVFFDVSPETARAVTMKLNAQSDPPGDALIRSTIGELANTVCGQAVSRLVEQGLRLDISPPTVIVRPDPVPSSGLFETDVISLEGEFGRICIKIVG